MTNNNVVNRTEYTENLYAISNPTCWQTKKIDGKITTVPTRPPSVIHRRETRFEVYPFGYQFVSKKLNARYFAKSLNSPQNPVFVDAQTGCGKTTMIFQELFPLLKRMGKKLLIINSRSALKQQTKYDAIDADAPELKEELTDIGITKHHIFGDIEVYSYQDFNNPKNIRRIRKMFSAGYYGAVVFDECHYFIADADFNVYTERQFDFLLPLAISNHVFRIYLTATPDYIFDRIYEKECCCTNYNAGIMEGYIDFNFKHFHFKRNYSYLQVRFFPIGKLKDLITNYRSKKILVFTESKKRANEEMEKLKEDGIESVFLFDSESSHDKESELSNKVREGLLHNEVNVDVLFATKCLDAGVTINTKELIVICCLKDKIDFMQAIGRKRIKGNETVSLYVPLYRKEDIVKYRYQLECSLAKMNEAVETFPDGILMNAPSYPDIPVYVEEGKYRHNKFALAKLQYQLWDIQLLEEKIASAEDEPEITIAKHILSWMELEETFSADMILGYEKPNPAKKDDDRTAILQIVQQYEHLDLNFEDFQELQEKMKCYDPRKDKRKDRADLSTQTMNSIFSDHSLSYRIEKRGNLYHINKLEVPSND